jgi:phosphopantothenoylcysteine synthetase/decarboxylase
MRTANEAMQRTLQEQFNTALMALEVRMESTTQKMIESLGASLTRAVATMTTQAESGREFLMAFKAQADRMQMHADRLINRNHQGTHNTPPRKKQGIQRATHSDDDDDAMDDDDDDDDDTADGSQNEMDEETTADGSHNPKARRATKPKDGASATTGDNK